MFEKTQMEMIKNLRVYYDTFNNQFFNYMKRTLLFLLTLSAFSTIEAQRSEAGLFLGYSYYMGDINPTTPFAMAKPAAGLIYRYNINPRWAFKLNGFYGTIQSDDAVIKHNEVRNLSFRSPVTDISAQLELNFFPYVTGKGSKMYFSPYMFAGLSVFHFNPQAYYNGVLYDLQPLGTEGQGTSFMPERNKYSLTAISIPFGLGVKYSIGNSWCIGGEWSMRKTFTDYLDDVSTTYVDTEKLAAENTSIAAALADRSISSDGNAAHEGLQRGNSQNNDWYSFIGIFITYSLKSPFSKRCDAYRSGGSSKFHEYRY
jgi:hypothetical protein